MTQWRAADVRAYLERGWAELERSPTTRDTATSLAVAGELRAQAVATVRGWPAAEDREADLEAHIRLAALLTRAHRAELGRARSR